MIGKRDHRRHGGGEIVLTMLVAEFREHVEWLEDLAPRDGATKDWRELLDELVPPDHEIGDE